MSVLYFLIIPISEEYYLIMEHDFTLYLKILMLSDFTKKSIHTTKNLLFQEKYELNKKIKLNLNIAII